MTSFPSVEDWKFSQEFIEEDSFQLKAREKSTELGIKPIGAGVGSLLKFLASTIDASNVVEIGSGTGLSGLWLFKGMNTAGVLTSIDKDPERQRVSKDIFSNASISPNKIRLIAGKALEVITRLTDNAYDLVFINGDKLEYETILEEAMRLLRPGGILIYNNVLNDAQFQNDPDNLAVLRVLEKIKEDKRLVSVMIPNGTGVIACSYRPS
jgi:predicted O-methyltransferase YrrM